MVYGDSEIEDLFDEFCFEDKLGKLEGTSTSTTLVVMVVVTVVVQSENRKLIRTS